MKDLSYEKIQELVSKFENHLKVLWGNTAQIEGEI